MAALLTSLAEYDSFRPEYAEKSPAIYVRSFTKKLLTPGHSIN
jgi:hypothetical protein